MFIVTCGTFQSAAPFVEDNNTQPTPFVEYNNTQPIDDYDEHGVPDTPPEQIRGHCSYYSDDHNSAGIPDSVGEFKTPDPIRTTPGLWETDQVVSVKLYLMYYWNLFYMIIIYII